MSDEQKREFEIPPAAPDPTLEDRLLTVMADQQSEFETHLVSLSRRVRDLERRRTSPGSSFFDFDFENIFLVALVATLGVIALKIYLSTLAKAGEGK
jgi:hypothetical protein